MIYGRKSIPNAASLGRFSSKATGSMGSSVFGGRLWDCAFGAAGGVGGVERMGVGEGKDEVSKRGDGWVDALGVGQAGLRMVGCGELPDVE